MRENWQKSANEHKKNAEAERKGYDAQEKLILERNLVIAELRQDLRLSLEEDEEKKEKEKDDDWKIIVGFRWCRRRLLLFLKLVRL
jgi:hypothetical protein